MGKGRCSAVCTHIKCEIIEKQLKVLIPFRACYAVSVCMSMSADRCEMCYDGQLVVRAHQISEWE
jgi:hypothetical protein